MQILEINVVFVAPKPQFYFWAISFSTLPINFVFKHLVLKLLEKAIKKFLVLQVAVSEIEKRHLSYKKL